jgi:hypothetical protein
MEAGNPGSFFCFGHAVPLRIDIDTHTMIVMKADKFDLASAPRTLSMVERPAKRAVERESLHDAAASRECDTALDGALRPLR